MNLASHWRGNSSSSRMSKCVDLRVPRHPWRNAKDAPSEATWTYKTHHSLCVRGQGCHQTDVRISGLVGLRRSYTDRDLLDGFLRIGFGSASSPTLAGVKWHGQLPPVIEHHWLSRLDTLYSEFWLMLPTSASTAIRPYFDMMDLASYMATNNDIV